MQITVNENGARTLADARPMRIDGHNVYVIVGGGTASLMVGGRIVAERTAAEMSTTEAQAWAVDYRNGLVADETAVEEACSTEAVYAGAVEQVRAQAAELFAKAEAGETFGDAPYRYRNSMGRMVTFHNSDPRHPAQAAKSQRADAEILAAWTASDEQNYSRYVSCGIGATDGRYAPESRVQWKRFLAA